LPHDTVIAIICHEDYRKVMDGPDAVDLEAMTTYVRCAEIATALARHIREDLGYPALAHHNGGVQIQAIPVMHQVGFGELGKHGSLIHPKLGANFRPGFVTTTLPLAHDAPIAFGVQDYCLGCNLCTNNCPADAIPSEYIMTEGVRRWLTDIEKCYTVSRLRPAYCHICVDVCPYIHKETGDEAYKDTYKAYMKGRKADGYKTPKRLDASAEG
jgi:epoxyqueuosine reductase QueG